MDLVRDTLRSEVVSADLSRQNDEPIQWIQEIPLSWVQINAPEPTISLGASLAEVSGQVKSSIELGNVQVLPTGRYQVSSPSSDQVELAENRKSRSKRTTSSGGPDAKDAFSVASGN